MKKNYIIIASFLLTISIFAQVPEKMSYQAVVRDASNDLVTFSPVGIQISILQGSSSGTAVYVETQTATSNANGLVSIEIGAGNVVSGTFASIDWSNDTYFVKTETDPLGGTSYTITGTSQLLSVPYALHAKTAENVANDLVDDADSDPTNEIELPTGGTNGQILETDGSGKYTWVDQTTDTDTQLNETAVDGFVANNGYLTAEVDGSTTNEIQNISSVLTEGNDAGTKTITNLGAVTIGSTITTADAALDINVTNGALLLPRLNNSQQNSLNASAGMLIFNTDINKFRGYKTGDVVDQQQNTYNTCSGGVGQSFTAGSTGMLTAIEIYGCSNWASLTLKIFDGEGMSGTLLHSQQVHLSSPAAYKFILSTPINVTAGQVYTFDFDGNGYTAWSNVSNPYSDGQGYINDVPNSSMDWRFKTYIDDSGWVDLH